ncbi:MAG: type I-F CRISPR-associated helicase Cas3 [Pseudomonadales bacterium]|nr:type I-F CRISPR-associated helicase Cas3 [Pseudomonadales bacterium]
MMVTFVSQCEKKALNRTRRVLDAFADRIGDNTWQTVITQEGLLAVKKLLRKTATKNTAVSCHWIRSRSRSELVWVVGNRRKFNELGMVPVNSTQKPNVSTDEENNWQHGHSMQIVAVLAALLHDIGKATIGFQDKLLNSKGGKKGDPYRHEWISLRLFQAMIYGCNADEEWLSRLINFDAFMDENPNWLNRMSNDSVAGSKPQRLDNLPKLAQLIAWLIVTHHRLPTYGLEYFKTEVRTQQQQSKRSWGEDFIMKEFYADLAPFEQWVKNANAGNSQDFWHLKETIMASKSWQKKIKRWARKARDHAPLQVLAKQTISDPLLMHLSRLCLMLADHNYSSLPKEHKARVQGDTEFIGKLAANTDKNRDPKQALDEHLIGVADFASRIALLIPNLNTRLTGLPDKHRPFLAQTRAEGYLWQNKSFLLAKKLQPQAQQQGFFGVNMASTGRGKTLANARIMYALGNKDSGARFTIALGLRVLTLQTGRALRAKLDLDDEQLAVLVGGAANRELFEMVERQEDAKELNAEDMGSESMEALFDKGDWLDGSSLPSEFDTLTADHKTRQLLYAPVVTCTVDHIMQASECSRGGRYIAPVLRLLTSDLVLDEPDDFDQRDLPALTRLVHLAGLFGSKLLLSSATLTPDLVTGLYQAYAAGRKIWNSHMGLNPNLPVPCGWFDEDQQTTELCIAPDQFTQVHQQFVTRRVRYLEKQPKRRQAKILPIELPPPKENEKVNMAALAKVLLQGATQLHSDHAETCAETGKRASIGLIRMANVQPIIKLVKALFEQTELDGNTHIHLCCYHAKQLLVLRNTLEQKLDRILSRSGNLSIFDHHEVKAALASSPAQNHLFIVVASPVAEVGRDHDYDWAIVEPSSMRSLIQLAGRVWRHRPEKIAEATNILVMSSSMLGLGNNQVAFTRPGFEQQEPPKFKLSTHNCSELLTEQQLSRVDSIPRIARADELHTTTSLTDLEHGVMEDLINNSNNFVSAFWREDNGNRASAHLQKISPFRHNDRVQQDYVCLPVTDDPNGYKFTLAESAWESLEDCVYQSKKIQFSPYQPDNAQVTPWLTTGLDEALQEIDEQQDPPNLAKTARKFASVRLEEIEGRWLYDSFLGFWR